jgi:hypothetical protein
MHATSIRFGLATLVAMAGLACVPAALADTAARVLETQPGASGSLGRQESFYVRIAYETDEPVSIWARPFLNGVQVMQTYSNASASHLGSGEALGWFALTGPGEVDEVRLIAGGGTPYREWELARYPVQLEWTAAPPAASPRAAWVDTLIGADEARRREEAAQRAGEPLSAGDMLLGMGFMFAVLALLIASLVVPIWSVIAWRGGWRLAAAVPAAMVMFVVLRIIADTVRDPTSHNLWPFEILQVGVLALLLIGALKLARRFSGVEA